MDKKQTRIRRAARTRARIARLNVHRLSVHRTNAHLYAQIFSPCGTQVLASASTLEAEVRQQLSSKGSNIAAATFIGHRIAQKAKAAGIESLAFDRSGFRYHGRVRALAEAAREAGLKF
ncbi:50S ribosomal subunit protein L18 [Candidatus Glomeribacter gigasporarum BEG34]|uniref:Large ribosomal subunit protein uL18 n=1 Tax=Candidatus Glomeribacter gigasporarum BEG34 TaxID=1070319 RepID=G2J9K6_9BURK|nr:50S ribosomal protein L18 [Candidatus Glomeribacter gigasporarum]CCD29453.1 50S ribosomal subunit protein L18 [Candidatus Glomeribacter gigasporarum BEG34]